MTNGSQQLEVGTAIRDNRQPIGNGHVGAIRPDWPRSHIRSPAPSRPAADERQPTNSINSTNGVNGNAARSVWELPALIQPLPRRTTQRQTSFRVRRDHAELIEILHELRFATARQIQQLFAERFRSYRMTQHHLAGLVREGLLDTAGVRHTAPNFPFVYFATQAGLHFVQRSDLESGRKARPPRQSTRPERGRTLTHILHELFTTQIDIDVRRTIAGRPDLKLLWHERRFSQGGTDIFAPGENGEQRRLEPDAALLIDIAGQAPLLLLVELDNNSNVPLRRIREKLRLYERWFETDALRFAADLQLPTGRLPSARLLWITAGHTEFTHGNHRLADVLMASLETKSTTRDKIWLTSADALHRHSSAPAPMTQSVWLRARHAKSWLPDYQSFLDTLPNGRHLQAVIDRKKSSFIRDKIVTMSRHPLFPHPQTPAFAQKGD